MSIKVDHLSKRFGSFVAVNDVSFEIGTGSLVALLGPSGGGKSTILRMIAGLETPDSGSVWFDGDEATHHHARNRQVGFVFQHYALFRHMSVEANVAFGLEVRNVARAVARRRARDLIGLVGLHGLEDRYPSQLSGGQRQRVALARALAPEPKLLLLDEPFGAVDAKVREELRQWLRRLHDDVGVTSIFVTHDQDEAFAVSDRVIVIRNGAVEQHGTPTEILDEPATEFVARFVGDVNVLPAIVKDNVATSGPLHVQVAGDSPDGIAALVIRSQDIQLTPDEGGTGIVERTVMLGSQVRVHLQVDGLPPMFAQLPRRTRAVRELEPGRRVRIELLSGRAYPAQPASNAQMDKGP